MRIITKGMISVDDALVIIQQIQCERTMLQKERAFLKRVIDKKTLHIYDLAQQQQQQAGVAHIVATTPIIGNSTSIIAEFNHVGISLTSVNSDKYNIPTLYSQLSSIIKHLNEKGICIFNISLKSFGLLYSCSLNHIYPIIHDLTAAFLYSMEGVVDGQFEMSTVGKPLEVWLLHYLNDLCETDIISAAQIMEIRDNFIASMHTYLPLWNWTSFLDNCCEKISGRCVKEVRHILLSTIPNWDQFSLDFMIGHIIAFINTNNHGDIEWFRDNIYAHMINKSKGVICDDK